MKIATIQQYRAALARIAELRASGKSAENHREFAELEAAMATYVKKRGQPDVDKARPPGPARDPG